MGFHPIGLYQVIPGYTRYSTLGEQLRIAPSLSSLDGYWIIRTEATFSNNDGHQSNTHIPMAGGPNCGSNELNNGMVELCRCRKATTQADARHKQEAVKRKSPQLL